MINYEWCIMDWIEIISAKVGIFNINKILEVKDDILYTYTVLIRKIVKNDFKRTKYK